LSNVDGHSLTATKKVGHESEFLKPSSGIEVNKYSVRHTTTFILLLAYLLQKFILGLQFWGGEKILSPRRSPPRLPPPGIDATDYAYGPCTSFNVFDFVFLDTMLSNWWCWRSASSNGVFAQVLRESCLLWIIPAVLCMSLSRFFILFVG